MERMLLCQRHHFLSIFIIFETEKIPEPLEQVAGKKAVYGQMPMPHVAGHLLCYLFLHVGLTLTSWKIGEFVGKGSILTVLDRHLLLYSFP